MPKSKNGMVRLELHFKQAEQLGIHLFNYTLKYEINGARMDRTFTSREKADDYSRVLNDNGIFPKLKVQKVTS